MIKRAILVVLILAISTGTISAQNLLIGPECATYDSLYNRWLVSCWGNKKIIEIDSNGVQSEFVSLTSCLSNTIYDTLIIVSTGRSVKALDLATGATVWTKYISGSNQLDGMCTDTSGYFYVADYNFPNPTSHKIFKINLADQTVSNFVVGSGLIAPQDIVFDPRNNRLLVGCYAEDAPIQAVNLSDSIVYEVVITPFGYMDGLSLDREGNCYASSYREGCIYKYDSSFTNPPELIACDFDGPANIYLDDPNQILAVPHFNGDTVTFLQLGSPVIGSTNLSDELYGNNDGIAAPGETTELFVELINHHYDPVTAISGSLTCEDPLILITDSESVFGDISIGSTEVNDGDPFVIEIDPAHANEMVEFLLELTFTSGYGTRTKTFTFVKAIGPVAALIVDDHQGLDLSSYYGEAIEDLGKTYELYRVTDAGVPDLATLFDYDIVIWFTGDYDEVELEEAERTVLKSFLDNGGNLFLTGQGLAGELDTVDQSFLHDYLHASYLRDFHYAYLVADDGALVFDLSDSISISGPGGASNQTVLNHIEPRDGAVAEMKYYGQDDWGAISYSGEYRLIFATFGFEAIEQGNSQWTDRSDIFSQALAYFDWINPYYCCEIRADIDFDGAGPNISDLVFLVSYMFSGGTPPPCLEAADIDGDGNGPNISDLVYLVTYMFSGGPAPATCN